VDQRIDWDYRSSDFIWIPYDCRSESISVNEGASPVDFLEQSCQRAIPTQSPFAKRSECSQTVTDGRVVEM